MLKTFKFLGAPLAALMAYGTPIWADDAAPGRLLAETAFQSLDTADRGFIDQGEYLNHGSDIFIPWTATRITRSLWVSF